MIWYNCLYVKECASDLAELSVGRQCASDLAELHVCVEKRASDLAELSVWKKHVVKSFCV